jgi:hypothetical protein
MKRRDDEGRRRGMRREMRRRSGVDVCAKVRWQREGEMRSLIN